MNKNKELEFRISNEQGSTEAGMLLRFRISREQEVIRGFREQEEEQQWVFSTVSNEDVVGNVVGQLGAIGAACLACRVGCRC
ncbi:unnamed protein product [Amaranthus hypochondriacus]